MLYARTKNGVKYISASDAETIIKLYEEDKGYLCEGLFIVRSGDTFTAIDNLDGECWTEDFKTEKDALSWLFNIEVDNQEE